MNCQLATIVRGLALAAALSCAAAGHSDETAQTGLHVDRLPVDKILFLGNSITLHGPAPKIGWVGDWGMAASAREKDYVHLLVSQITKTAGGQPEVKVKNIADLERQLEGFNVRDGLKEELAFEADLVVVAIGENVAALETDEVKLRFQMAVAGLLSELKQHGKPTIFVRSVFWADPAKDEILKKVCEEAGGIYVDNSKLGSDEANFARAERKFEHDGVAAHPGDRGMKAIADALWAAIEKRASKRSE